MQDIRIDENGDFRCWKCGGKNFDEKRTLRSKAAFGVGALLTHKKLKCQSCGEYNQTGDAKPFIGAAKDKPPKPGSFAQVRAESQAARLAKKPQATPAPVITVPVEPVVAAPAAPMSPMAARERIVAALARADDALAKPYSQDKQALVDQLRAQREVLARQLAQADERLVRQQAGVATPGVPSKPVASVADELRKLAELRDARVLTEEEFAEQKAVVLGQYRPTSAPPPPAADEMIAE
jgi:hypothetical protein